MRRPRLLPDAVTLPVRPTIAPGRAYAAIGVSRQVAAIWRRRYGFPESDIQTGYLDTSALAAWLTARGVGVRWL